MADALSVETVTAGDHQGAVRLSASALNRLRELVALEKNPDLMLRLTVEGGGCSGFQYHFAFDTEKREDDRIFEQDGMRVVTDAASLELLAGCIVEFVENPGAAYFRIDNPNATSSCGCGMSFAI